MLLPNAVDASNRLQFEGRVEERFTEKHVACVDEVQPAGVSACMEEKHFRCWIFFEAGDAIYVVDGGVAYAEASECVAENVQEVAISGFQLALWEFILMSLEGIIVLRKYN